MPRKYEVHHVIIQSLEEKDLSRVDLLKQVRKKSGLTVSDKTLNEALMRLLRDNKITVTGYDIGIYEGISRVQSMKSDGIIFSKVNTDPIEIGIFLKKLESDNLEEAKKALHKLKILFRIKMNLISGNENSGPEKLDEMFTKILRYMNTQDLNQKRIITQRLSWALSDEKDSKETLKQLVAALRLN